MFQSRQPFRFRQEEDQRYSPTLRALGLGLGLGALHQAHASVLNNNPDTAAKTAYRWARNFEEHSPYGLGKTFGVGERRSAYVWDEVRVSYEDLVRSDGELTQLGEHLQKLVGDKLGPGGVKSMREGMVFRRSSPSDPYMYLAGREHIRVRWEKAGRRTGASWRMDRDLFERRTRTNFRGEWWTWKRMRRNWTSWKGSQFPRSYNRGVKMNVEGEEFFAQPHSAMTGQDLPGKARDYWRRVRVNMFELFERPQRLMADIGFGLKEGSYNKIFHLPFFGEGGMVNGMLLKRVLPVVIGLTALSYLDYKAGHRPSNFAASLPLRANLLRTDMTDNIPGARAVTNFYDRTVPGPQYGPLALPVLGATAGALWHYQKVLRGAYGAGEGAQKARDFGARIFAHADDEAKFLGHFAKGPVGIGTAIGTLALLPFIPGMLGSRKTGHELREIYSGREPVPIKAGRWWELGTTPYEGGRIKAWRPHWYQLFTRRVERNALYGSEQEYWRHNPILHPFRYLRDPYWLERQHYTDRPYPMTSPALSNVPLIGPFLAATIGKLIKPPVRMHPEWDGRQYTLYSSRLEPKPGTGLPPPAPEEEFSAKHTLRAQLHQMFDWLGLMGFIGKSAKEKIFPDQNQGKDVYFQGSRQMTSLSRRYYEHELGAGFGPEFNDLGEAGAFGYSEPLRRLVQREEPEPQANEIPNTMPSWLPGEDYFINFREGDPYIKVDMGYARLPGSGYESLHPEVAGVNPENYPDLVKLRILSDVAPYSSAFAGMRSRVSAQARKSTEVAIEYEKVMDQVRRTKDSTIRTDERRFTGKIDEIEGTVKNATPTGIELEEYPGRSFTLSSLGMSAADLSAVALAEQNNLTKSAAAREVESRQGRLAQFFRESLSPGTHVRMTIPAGAAEYGEKIRAVVQAGDLNINQALATEGLARYREDQGGAESRAMHGTLGRAVGKLAETLAFTGDNSAVNPLRFLPSPGHTKLWQERTAIAQYEQEEVIGTRMRRWHRPIHDFLAPYARGMVKRFTGQRVVSEDTQFRRDLNTLSDMMKYLRALRGAGSSPEGAGRYTSQARRTAVGSNTLSDSTYVASTLSDREAQYFRRFLAETDPDKRKQILDMVAPETARALQAQWLTEKQRIDQAEGERTAPVGEEGRIYTDEGLQEFRRAKTHLGYGDYMRSQEVAEFFHRTGFHLPDDTSEVWADEIDYEDVKLKIIQNEGYDMHDFGIFEDRANLLWRKPWVDGVARELTSGDNRPVENLRRQVEQLMLAARDRDPDVRVVSTKSRRASGKVRVDVHVNDAGAVEKDMRRNPERYN